LLGVCRQFITIWTDSSNHGKPFYRKSTKAVDTILANIKPPNEIRRLPRSLEDRKFWKASEFRNFLLFYSPVALADVLPRKYFLHWMLLVNAINLLLGESITEESVEQSRDCLIKFVVQIEELYGIEHISYNVHQLTHLADAVTKWGPLWSHAAFIYEDCIGALKSIYHGTQLVPKQITKYFSAWKSLAQAAHLLTDASDEVSDLFNELCGSCRSVASATTGCFVGLGKSTLRKLNITELVAANNNVALLSVPAETVCAFYERFTVNKRLYSTSSYSLQFKRNNSLIQLNTGELGEIVSCCVAGGTCVCDTNVCCCSLPQSVILFVKRFTVTNSTAIDTYSGLNLTGSVYMQYDDDNADTVMAVKCDQLAGKCICVQSGECKYLIVIPQCVSFLE